MCPFRWDHTQRLPPIIGCLNWRFPMTNYNAPSGAGPSPVSPPSPLGFGFVRKYSLCQKLFNCGGYTTSTSRLCSLTDDVASGCDFTTRDQECDGDACCLAAVPSIFR